MRRLAARLAIFVVGVFCGVLAAYCVFATRGQAPGPWHDPAVTGEPWMHGPDAPADLAAYRRLEDRLFNDVAAELGRRVEHYPPFSRFDPASRTHPSRFGRDWNRTWELVPAGEPLGEALLLHGLTDSPYSLRSVGALLVSAGYRVVALRLPGHGAAPGGLASVTRHDWRAAVRLGVAATGGRAESTGSPFLLVGYSNGAALALDYTLTAIQDDGGPVPDRLILLSPALAVTPAAAFARWQQRLSRLPGLSQLGWQSIDEEFDPFKFNSFPMHAGAEIHELTSEIEERLSRLGEAELLPPLLAVQSVVDATVPPVASLTRLYARVRRSEEVSELVLFDANREAGIGALLGPAADELLALARPGQRFDFGVTLITNAATGTAEVEKMTLAAGSLERVRTPVSLAWPDGVYSLSHVAIPFPPDDPTYGVGTSPVGRPFPLGALELKGERGVLRIPDRLLTRLRYNPFFAVVEDEILEFLAASPPTDHG